jgi:hypothetical protein
VNHVLDASPGVEPLLPVQLIVPALAHVGVPDELEGHVSELVALDAELVDLLAETLVGLVVSVHLAEHLPQSIDLASEAHLLNKYVDEQVPLVRGEEEHDRPVDMGLEVDHLGEEVAPDAIDLGLRPHRALSRAPVRPPPTGW